MLGKTANGLFWMFRYLERSENIARLVEAGFRMALTRSQRQGGDWSSILTTAGLLESYEEKYDDFENKSVVDFLLRDRTNPSSVLSSMAEARRNARLARTALTREVWEAVNASWLELSDILKNSIRDKERIPDILAIIRRQSAQVQGAVHGTMLRNDIYDFTRLGTFVERADNTARILDVKYYVLLPSASSIGSSLDNVQWETILRSVSAQQAYRWLHQGEPTASAIAKFLILDQCMPRSLTFCVKEMDLNLRYLNQEYGQTSSASELAKALKEDMKSKTIEEIFDSGLHEFIGEFLQRNIAIAGQIETDYRFFA
ncbi:alpha-E domain-containing protein [Litorimonas sp.]|uniref:alpha-E domain-containing protein n=1 Tax=Litorimonas sp. TaxID=1892381 RepID=UPI003A86520B